MRQSVPTPEFIRFLKVATDARAAQKRYFQNRKTPEAGQHLAESIALERQLDALILEYNQAEQLQQPLFNPLNSKPMFFQNLAHHAPNLDIQIRIMSKDGKFTVSVLPMTTDKLKPLTVTATPEELDAEFIDAILQPVNSAATIKDQVAEYCKEVEADLAKQKQAVDKEAEKTTAADAAPVAKAEAETAKEAPAEKPVKKSRSKKTRFAKAPEEEPQEEPAEEVQPETEQNSGIVNGEPWPPAPDESGTEKDTTPAVEETPAIDEPSEKPNWEVVHTDVEPNVEPETPATGALIIPLVEAASEAKETSETEEPKKTAFPEIIAAESEQMAASKPTPPRPTPALF